MSDLVLTEQKGSVFIITLNRPKRHNSLVPSLLQELLAAFDGIPKDCRAVALLANGGSFSTGGDVLGFYKHLSDISNYASLIVGLLNELMLTMLNLPIPIVTAVHGIVTGGSLGFVLASDIVFVSPEVSFTPYYAIVGFSPDGGWSTLLPQIIGQQRAAETIYCNRTISAKKAVKWGLASSVIPQKQISEKTVETAAQIAGMKPGSIRHSKQLLNHRFADAAQNLELERQHFVQQIVTDEATHGIQNFVS